MRSERSATSAYVKDRPFLNALDKSGFIRNGRGSVPINKVQCCVRIRFTHDVLAYSPSLVQCPIAGKLNFTMGNKIKHTGRAVFGRWVVSTPRQPATAFRLYASDRPQALR